MGWIARIFFWLLLVLILVLAGLWVARGMVAEMIIRRGLTIAGAEDAQFRVETLTPSRLQVSDFTIGPEDAPSLAVDDLVIDYEWRDLWQDRRIHKLTIGPGKIRTAIDDNGAVSLDGIGAPGTQSAGARPVFDPSALPLDAITVLPITIEVETPEGLATGVVEGGYTIEEGGQVSLVMSAPTAGPNGIILSQAELTAEMTLREHGEIVLTGAFTGDVTTPSNRVENINISINGNGTSWIDLINEGMDQFAGGVEVEIQSAEFPAPDSEFSESNVPAAARSQSLQAVRQSVESITGAGSLDQLGVSGAVYIAVAGSDIKLYGVPGKILTVQNIRGESLSLQSLLPLEGEEAQPLISMSGEQLSLAARLQANTQLVQFDADVKATQASNAAPLTFDGTVTLPTQTLNIPVSMYPEGGAIDVERMRASIAGSLTEQGIDGTLEINAVLNRLDGAPLTLGDITINDIYTINYTAEPELLTVFSQTAQCLNVAHLSGRLPDISLKADLRSVSLCPTAAPLLRYSAASGAAVNSVLSASSLRYDHLEVTASGVPPELDISLTATPEGRLSLNGRIAGGNLLLNDQLQLTSARGELSATASGEDFSSSVDLDHIVISQPPDQTTMVAPVVGQGQLKTNGARADFSARMVTLDGVELGRATGFHIAEDSSGEMDIVLSDLAFAPGGTQPALLLPGLTGIIGTTTGHMGGVAHASWTADGLLSSADLTVDDLSFVGPGIAVAKTGGVSGRLRLDSLMPIRSDGIQTLFIEEIDLGAIKLERGDVSFSFPGDETLEVLSAEFPWFGGTIGAYETSAAMTGERFVTNLKAYDVNLDELLQFLEIDGLSGEGILEGTLPFVFEDNKIHVVDAVMATKGGGVVRYDSAATREAARTSQQAGLAFGILKELKFDELSATINGPLDGDIKIGLNFVGTNDIDVQGQMVRTPVIYRINLEAPLSNLIYQGQLSQDFLLQKDILDEVIRGEINGTGTIDGEPIDRAPIQGTPIQGTPIQGTPIEGTPIQGSTIHGTPIDGTPVN